MSKILNISDSIKINKDNLQLPFVILSKANYGAGTVKFTLTENWWTSSIALIFVENNYGQCSIFTIGVHSGNIYDAGVMLGSTVYASISVSKEDKTVTVTLPTYGSATLVDFAYNPWV